MEELEPGNRIVLADGSVTLEVVGCGPDGVACVVRAGGEIRSRQGMNLPGAKLALPSLTEQDRHWARWSVDQSIDYLSLSFVRSPVDLQSLRDLLAGVSKTNAHCGENRETRGVGTTRCYRPNCRCRDGGPR